MSQSRSLSHRWQTARGNALLGFHYDDRNDRSNGPVRDAIDHPRVNPSPQGDKAVIRTSYVKLMTLNNIEEEVVFLKAIEEIIDSMVNFEMLTLQGTDPDSAVLFNSSTHQKFFNVVLVDFLSCTDERRR